MFDSEIPDDDSDILDITYAESSSSSKIEDEDGIRVMGPNGSSMKLPRALAHELDKLMGIDSNRLSQELEAVIGMFGFFKDMTIFATDGALLAAVAQVLDNITDGQVTLHYELRESERILLYTHQIIRLQKKIMDIFKFEEADSILKKMRLYMLSFLSLTTHVHNKAIKSYNDTCAKLGKEPDTVLLETGSYGVRDMYAKIALLYPPGVTES